MRNKAWIRGSCKLGIDQTEFFFLHDAGTVVCVESRGRLVGVRWTRAVREGVASV